MHNTSLTLDDTTNKLCISTPDRICWCTMLQLELDAKTQRNKHELMTWITRLTPTVSSIMISLSIWDPYSDFLRYTRHCLEPQKIKISNAAFSALEGLQMPIRPLLWSHQWDRSTALVMLSAELQFISFSSRQFHLLVFIMCFTILKYVAFTWKNSPLTLLLLLSYGKNRCSIRLICPPLLVLAQENMMVPISMFCSS